MNDPSSAAARGPGHCAHCPVDPGQDCQGRTAPRLCRLADPLGAEFRPDYRRLLVDLSRTPGMSKPTPRDQASGLARTLDLLRRMHACPDRTTRTDCGCAGAAWCARGRGRQGIVNHHDCLACLQDRSV